MGYKMCDTDDVEAVNGVFRPIRRALGVTAFGINQEELPPNGDAYPDTTTPKTARRRSTTSSQARGRWSSTGRTSSSSRPVRVREPGTKRKILPVTRVSG